MKVLIINYGMGNLASVKKSFDDLDVNATIANHFSELYQADKIILPGVGSYNEGMKKLVEHGWKDALSELVLPKKKHLLGICLGMQMLSSEGSEGGITQGLDFIPGKVEHLNDLGCKSRVPHVGWNEVFYNESVMPDILSKIPVNSDFYFVHSYAFIPESGKFLIGTTPYDLEITSIVQNENIVGCQFHPEKSSKAGRQLLSNFLAM